MLTPARIQRGSTLIAVYHFRAHAKVRVLLDRFAFFATDIDWPAVAYYRNNVCRVNALARRRHIVEHQRHFAILYARHYRTPLATIHMIRIVAYGNNVAEAWRVRRRHNSCCRYRIEMKFLLFYN